jgi:hypothetical protein
MVCLAGQERAGAGVRSSTDSASPVEITECFQTVDSDAVLARDLVCEVTGLDRAAIEIVASNVTVDLGGHALFGYPVGDLGIRADGFDGVTVKNGTIDGFLIGLTFAEGSDVTLQDVTIRNLESEDFDEYVRGVWIVDCQDAVVRDVTFEFLPMAHKVGIEFYWTDFTVDRMALNGGAAGIDINFKSEGSVVNSRFLGATIGGILVEGSDGARIADNEFVRNEVGIDAAGPASEPISGLAIEANTIEHGHVGIRFQAISESTIRDNVVRGQWRGISLEPNHCEDTPGPECQYSSGNVITGNTVVGNFVDLYHHDTCVPNTWDRNICLAEEGAEIPPCSGLWRRVGRRLKPVGP